MSTPRIFATCDIGREALDRLRVRGYALEVYPERRAPPYELVVARAASGIAALVTTLRDRIDDDLLAAGARAGLRLVAQMAVGVDNIDCAAASRYRIAVSHTPDVLTDASAEFAFFMIGCAARKTWENEAWLRDGHWDGWHPSEPWLGTEVSGKTLAVIGAGRIGKALVDKALGFDLDILVHDPHGEDRRFAQAIRTIMQLRHASGLCRRLQTLTYVSLDEALRRADFVSLHVPLVLPDPTLPAGMGREPTLHLMDAARLARMKPSAYLINTSRGRVVDEHALAEALRAGRLAGAALDVFEVEPLPAASPLRDPSLAGKLRLFPHVASAAHATRLSPDPDIGMAGRTVQTVIDVLEGNYDGDMRRVPHIVNRKAFEDVTGSRRSATSP